MKVEINNLGIMKISPENEEEDNQLVDWYKENKNRPTNHVIIFGRY